MFGSRGRGGEGIEGRVWTVCGPVVPTQVTAGLTRCVLIRACNIKVQA